MHEGAQLWQPLLLLGLHSVLELKTRSVVLGCEGRVETTAKELQKLLSYAPFFAAHVSGALNKGSSRENYWEGSNWVCCVSIIKSKHTHTLASGEKDVKIHPDPLLQLLFEPVF